ncbi:MAG TPA: hypothetical protein VN516_06050 [Candidatus Baltobacteraceae bacterium]|nr:hypothetical protein [Candidatus Baltobacteraceae bacterium]
MKSVPGKLLIALAILIAIFLITLHFLNGNVAQPPPKSSIAPANNFISPQITIRPHKVAELVATNDGSESEAEIRALKIPREQIEQCLQSHGRGVTNLLAAFHVSDDTNYLNEAAANSSDDPRVQFTVLARNAFPDEMEIQMPRWMNFWPQMIKCHLRITPSNHN